MGKRMNNGAEDGRMNEGEDVQGNKDGQVWETLMREGTARGDGM